jgi:hypothetical protein
VENLTKYYSKLVEKFVPGKVRFWRTISVS